MQVLPGVLYAAEHGVHLRGLSRSGECQEGRGVEGPSGIL